MPFVQFLEKTMRFTKKIQENKVADHFCIIIFSPILHNFAARGLQAIYTFAF